MEALMAQAITSREALPIMEVNVTPLIDVMLVLLVMFIITIPVQTHGVELDLPQPREFPAQPDPVKNKVVITAAGQILWNGKPISQMGLRQTLAVTQQMSPVPELQLQPEPTARYELVDEVLAITKQAGVEQMGFVGNERYANF
jgi:biopolymer transport protein ExbD